MGYDVNIFTVLERNKSVSKTCDSEHIHKYVMETDEDRVYMSSIWNRAERKEIAFTIGAYLHQI